MKNGRDHGQTNGKGVDEEAERLIGPALRRAGATLNRVVRRCRDSARMHRVAAVDLSTERDRESCLRTARKHAEHAEALQALAYKLRIETFGRGSLGGAARSAWLAFDAALRGTRDETLLAHCTSAEAKLDRAYATALDKQLPAAMRDLLAAQRASIGGKTSDATEHDAAAQA